MSDDRPTCVVHWRDIEAPDNAHYRDDDELLAIGAPFGRHFGLTRIGIHHERVPPGRRTSFPHAESLEEEFVYVIKGTPDVWLDGVLHRLAPGDGVGFPPGTGQAHTFINNTEDEVRLLVVGESGRPGNRLYYPRHPALETKRKDWWTDHPDRRLGDHDGRPDRVQAVKRDKPSG